MGVKIQKKMKIRDSHLVENVISFLLTPFVCDLLQHTLIYDRYSWRPFLAQNRMTWRHWNVIFSKMFWPNLTKFLDKVSNWCPIRYWKFGGDILRSSQVIANIREGGRICPPPPAGRGLRLIHSLLAPAARWMRFPIQIQCVEVATTARYVKKYKLRNLHHVFE